MSAARRSVSSAANFATPTRRRVLGAAAPLALLGAAPGLVVADARDAIGASIGTQMREQVAALLAMLEPHQREAASFPFEGRRRRAWNFMLGSRRAPGLALEDMTEPQKATALYLLATALSPDGLTKTERIMLQQDILRDEWGKGSPSRNRERFSLQVYGTPAANGAWSWRFEGHHLSLTFTVVADELVSHTPMSFSSEPNPVPSGPHKGLVVLQEESLGRALFADLSPANSARALIRDSAFGNIVTTAGREDAIATREGVALADLPTAQAEAVMALVDVFTVANLPSAVADDEAARISGGDVAATHFAWAGNARDGAIYYRIHGDTFLIEFATVRGQPLHHHAVRHDLSRNFGDHVA